MKKILYFICVVALLLSLISCDQVKNREYNEEEVLAAAKPLIKESIALNEIFWGERCWFEKKALSLLAANI